MALAQIQDIPENEIDFNSWSLSHAAHHDDIIRVINQRQAAAHTTLTQFDGYVLDPFDPEDMTSWLRQHQVMHQQMDKVLNIQGFDLTTLDWQDRESVASWFQLHYAEHAQAGSILNLG